jgi:hypothetical protein
LRELASEIGKESSGMFRKPQVAIVLAVFGRSLGSKVAVLFSFCENRSYGLKL